MIQRIQTLWLLLAAACAFLTFQFPFFNLNVSLPGESNEFTAQSRIALTILTSILGALCLFLIFLYKNRKLQFRLTLVGLAFSGVIIYLYFYYKDETMATSIFSLFTFFIPIFLLMAARGIYHDIRLIRSLDRIR